MSHNLCSDYAHHEAHQKASPVVSPSRASDNKPFSFMIFKNMVVWISHTASLSTSGHLYLYPRRIHLFLYQPSILLCTILLLFTLILSCVSTGRDLSSTGSTLSLIKHASAKCPCSTNTPSRSNCSTELILRALFMCPSHQSRSTKLISSVLFKSSKSFHQT